MRLFLFVLLASLFTTACGQKGPLYKTPEAEVKSATKTTAPTVTKVDAKVDAADAASAEKTQ